MTLKEQAEQYVRETGIPEVAKAMDVRESTVKNWLATKRFPLELIEHIMQSSTPAPEPAPVIPDAQAEVLLKVMGALTNISERLGAVEAANYRPEPRPVQGPRVVASTAQDGDIAFQETARLGGNRPYEVPEPTQDVHGMPMSELLKKKLSPADQLAQVLARFAK